MAKQVYPLNILGMNRDVSPSVVTPEYAYEIRNMRFVTDLESKAMDLQIEKANLNMGLFSESKLEIIGNAVINDIFFVIFALDGNNTVIILAKEEVDSEGKPCFGYYRVYEGNINMVADSPIETLVSFENQNAIKVYWVDGRNQPRVINLAKHIQSIASTGDIDDKLKSKWESEDTPFDFIPNLKLNEDIQIVKDNSSQGLFSPGTIQYVCTYYNLYGQETNIFYISSLYYTSFEDRGASPDSSVSNSFTITLNNLDTNFEYIRIYSIHRTSLDSIPTVKKVIDLAIPQDNSPLIYTDNGTNGLIEDPTLLLYIGGRNIIAGTMALKHNTLFLGNLKDTNDPAIEPFVEEYKGNIEFVNKPLMTKAAQGHYTYDNFLNKSLLEISTLKYGETYRFGVQLQRKSGEWTQPIFIEDKEVTQSINHTSEASLVINLVQGKLTLNHSDLKLKVYNDYVKIRPVIVYPKATDRSIICQGVVCPTVFNVRYRKINAPYAQASWFFRPYPPVSQNEESNLGDLGDGNNAGVPAIILAIYNENYSYNALDLYKITDGVIEIPLSLIGYKKARKNEESEFNYKVLLFNMPDGHTYLSLLGYLSDENWRLEKIHNDVVSDLGYIHGYNSYYYRANNIKIEEGLLFLEDEAILNGVKIYYEVLHCLLPATPIYDSDNNQIGEEPNSISAFLTHQSLLDSGLISETVYKGSAVEYRDHTPLPTSDKSNGEIQSNWEVMNSVIEAGGEDDHSDTFFIDHSIVTFHSPEIEFDPALQNMDLSNVKMKIVGYVPITGSLGDLLVTTETPPLSFYTTNADKTTVAKGLFRQKVGVPNISNEGHLGMVNGAFWTDEVFFFPDDTDNRGKHYNNTRQKMLGYAIYPWHKNGSLNNQVTGTSLVEKDSKLKTVVGSYYSAKLKHKVISNIKFSSNSVYLNPDDEVEYDLSSASIYNSNEESMTMLNIGSNDNPIRKVVYQGNVDLIVTGLHNVEYDAYDRDGILKNDPIKVDKKGYPILVAKGDPYYSKSINSGMAYTDSQQLLFNWSLKFGYVGLLNFDKIKRSDNIYEKLKLEDGERVSSEPISIKYKSGIHAVLALQGASEGYNYTRNILPNITSNTPTGYKPFWETADRTWHNQLQTIQVSPEYAWLWLVELVSTPTIRFGGTTPEAFQNNIWIPCGEPVNLPEEESSVDIYWSEGDTFYQRYDVLKTYPYSNEDPNSVIEILSFMCETRVNIAGRYDRNRNNINNFSLSPANFNLFNDVYSQSNNFFKAQILDKDLFNFNEYPSTVTWSLTKQNGADVDLWTHMTMGAKLDLDGSKGPVNKLILYNEQLLAFQDTAIALISYDENVQFTTESGVPVEVANSGKVQGYRYLNDTKGCLNKFSIVNCPLGLFWEDGFNNSIDTISENGVLSITNQGMKSWVKTLPKCKWSPINTEALVSLYDRDKNELLFCTGNDALAYNQVFTSFYDGMQQGVNLGSGFYYIDNDRCWKRAAANTYMYPNGIEFPVSPKLQGSMKATQDCIYESVEFRGYREDSNGIQHNMPPFEHMSVRNDYQLGDVELVNIKNRPSSLKKKFKMWRALFPRNKGSRDRIRNPWVYVKLYNDNLNNTDINTVLHDLLVYYWT